MSENTTPLEEREVDTLNPADLKALKAKLNSKAEREVLANHRDEYHDVKARIYSEHGIEFKAKLSPEQKAKKELEDLIARFPELAESIKASQAPKAQAEPEQDGPLVQHQDEPTEVYPDTEQDEHNDNPVHSGGHQF